MAQPQLTARTLGLAAGSLTLTHFTPQSINAFLTGIADVVQSKVARAAGPSPWLPNQDHSLRGTITAPSGDDGPPCTFNALTHIAVTRVLVAADPANISDTATMLREAAQSDSDTLRILALRIAARWNLSMFLKKEHLLTPTAAATDLPEYENNTPLPSTVVVHDVDGLAIVDKDTGERTPATHTPLADNAPESQSAEDDVEEIPTVDSLAAARA